MKKKLDKFSKNYRTFYSKKMSLSSPKYGFMIRDPKKKLFRITDLVFKKTLDPGSESATLIFFNFLYAT
jgi:hypothetical protein